MSGPMFPEWYAWVFLFFCGCSVAGGSWVVWQVFKWLVHMAIAN